MSNHPLSKGQDKTFIKVEAVGQNKTVKHLVPKKRIPIIFCQRLAVSDAAEPGFGAEKRIQFSNPP